VPCGRTLVAADTAEIGEYATSYNRVRLPKRRAAELNLLGGYGCFSPAERFGQNGLFELDSYYLLFAILGFHSRLACL
jgi:hypothetical protein